MKEKNDKEKVWINWSLQSFKTKNVVTSVTIFPRAFSCD